MSTVKTIAYVGNFSFPYGNASGSRVLANGRLLKSLGYEILFIGLDATLDYNSDLAASKQNFDGFDYYNLPYPLGMKGWLSYKDKFLKVISLLENYNLHSVISYGSPALSLFPSLVRKWTCEKNIYFIVDVVDWMGTGGGSILHKTIKFLDNDYQKRINNSKSDGVIAISDYLSNYYSNKGVKTVVIPPLVDSRRFIDLDFNFDFDSPVKLIYIGRPFVVNGKRVNEKFYKDRLDIVIDILFKHKELNFIFNVYGLTKDEYLTVVTNQKDILEELKTKIIFHGIISNNDGIKEIAKADFTILFRHVNKMTTAGFPTKFSETISCGTPIITTKTSDLKDYLVDGENGFFVDINNSQALGNKIKTILTMNKKDILIMKKKCHKSLIFNYTNFRTVMNDFLNSL